VIGDPTHLEPKAKPPAAGMAAGGKWILVGVWNV